MSNSNWILAVLEDLRRYAAKNGLTDLEQQLELASEAASLELSARAGSVDETGQSGEPGEAPAAEVVTWGSCRS